MSKGCRDVRGNERGIMGRIVESSKPLDRSAAALVELVVGKMSSDGSGIARTDEGVVFVEGALPGEVVEAEVVRRKRDFSLARLVRVKQASAGRVVPACSVFGTCGGCQLQHASYRLQLEVKADIVKDALSRIGGFDLRGLPDFECEPSPRQWGYRNKASFPVRKIKGKPVAGFYEADSHRLARLEACPVNAAPLNGLFSVIQRELPGLDLSVYDEREHAGALRHVVLRSGLHTGETLVSLVVNGRLNARNMKSIARLYRPLRDAATRMPTLTLNHNSRPGNVILGDRTEAIKGDGLISERLDEWTLRYDTSSFFQVNTDQAARLYRYARERAQGENALELYSGVGALTCYLARSNSVTAVEEWGSAVDLMERNMKDNGITNVRSLKGRAEDVMTNLPGGYDLVVLDPPRSGCERSVLDKILEFGPKRVLYVSCNPSTLARDAKILGEGGYRLKALRAFDMFPQTVHVETVASMEL
ncbi:MAG: 23S rRNA (uracil(1939)-C(5))-methyltransferase RlmD [Synergistaceae bacterium]|jgi:23S rRNA (uracil1939-C5)-methyltransferase|nr:23S rRNA (uracil(1939)-C(5))-methyltransferase RlmD [Synergistaceae bacterium]